MKPGSLRVGSLDVQPTEKNPRDRAVAWLFVAVQALLLAAVFLLPAGSAWTTPGWLSFTAHALSLIGLVALVIGLIHLGRAATPLPLPVPGGSLRSQGLYRYVRHPIYTGVMALAIGSAIPSGNVWIAVSALALVGWFAVKARWEERHLAATYPGYEDYAARTPRFVPWLRRRGAR
jgi:protein-S-isoprenylcysteine O-methyltransferase Ste14